MIIRDLKPIDIEAMVKVHQEAFPDYFSTAFGRSYLRILYASFVTTPDCVAVGAFQDGHLAGFAVGHTNWSRYFSKMINRYWFKLVVIVCHKFMTSSGFRKGIRSRLNYVSFALNPFGRRKYTQAHSTCPNRLVSLAVHPSFRRQGVAAQVVDHFCERMASLRAKTVGLSVFLDNVTAINFYFRTGWVIEKMTNNALYFIRHLAR